MANKIIPLIVYPTNMGYVNLLTPMIHGTGEPGAAINGMLDNASFTAKVTDSGVWSYQVSNPLTDFGNHTIRVTQVSCNNETSPETSVQFRADSQTLAQQTVDYPANHSYLNCKTPILRGKGKPGATIEATIQSATYETVVNQEGCWQIKVMEPLPEGFADLSVLQKDMGNRSPAVNVSFTVDTIAPAGPDLDKPGEPDYRNTPTPVICGKGEPGATIDATVDDKPFTAAVNQNGDWSFEVSQSLTDDIHIVGVRQKDAAGNVSPEKVNMFTVDTRQPAPPTVIGPVNGACCMDNRPVITGRGEKNCKIEVRLGERVFTTRVGEDDAWRVKVTDTLPEGANTFKLFQISEAGNVSVCADLTVKIDTSAPLTPVVLYPQNDGYVSRTHFTAKGTGEPDAAVECTVAGKKYTAKVKHDGSWTVEIHENENLQNTQYYSIVVRQIDPAGNVSPEQRIKFKMDTECLTAPAITSPADNTVLNADRPVIEGKGKAGATIKVNIGTEEYTAQADQKGCYQVTVSKGLPQGKNTANVSQCDKGNVSSTSSVSFIVDTVAPTAPQITCPAENQSLGNGSLVIEGSGEALAAVSIKLDDQCYETKAKDDGTWEFTVPETLVNGSHVILANQADLAGNQSAFSQIDFQINSGEPVISFSGRPIQCRILYNPPASDWASKVIVVLRTDKPVTVNNVCGSVFARVVEENGIIDFDYTDVQGNKDRASAGVTWADSKPPVIQIASSGNYFSSDKTVTYYKPCGSGVRCALLNDAPLESGKVVTEEGKYCVTVTDQVGNVAVEEFLIDKTQPDIAGIEDQAVYQNDVCITCCDNLSGIKCAQLNGKPFASGTVLTENGDYTLTVTDFGDNIKSVHFQIQK